MWEAILTDHIETLPVGERWNIRARLQELAIACECLADGSLAVEIKNCHQAILVAMILFRFNSSRQQQVDWLERCWQSLAVPGG
ncbi:MAG: hypothetical protein Q6L50_05200 [Gloeomargarita sp. GMQP_bins_120]